MKFSEPRKTFVTRGSISKHKTHKFNG